MSYLYLDFDTIAKASIVQKGKSWPNKTDGRKAS